MIVGDVHMIDTGELVLEVVELMLLAHPIARHTGAPAVWINENLHDGCTAVQAREAMNRYLEALDEYALTQPNAEPQTILLAFNSMIWKDGEAVYDDPDEYWDKRIYSSREYDETYDFELFGTFA